MKFELRFDKEIYKKQMDLLFDIAWKEKIAYYKNAHYLGFILLIIGFLLIFERPNLLAVVFIIFGLGTLIPYFYYFFKIKRISQGFEYVKNIEIEAIENCNQIWELTEKGLIIKVNKEERILEWAEFVVYFVKENNLFLVTNKHEPLILDEIEVGAENFKYILNFVESRVELKK